MNKTIFFSVLVICTTILTMYFMDKVDLKKQRTLYNACIEDVKANYNHQWDYRCKQEKQPSNCGLSVIVAKMLDEDFANQKKACLAIFKERAFQEEE